MTAHLSWEVITRHKDPHDFQLETHISLKHDYVYLQVCKAGSSTLRHHLQSVELEGTRYRVQDVNNKRVSPHLWPYQLKDAALFDFLEADATRRFAFVRNPFTRLLSAYLQRIAQPTPSRKALGHALGIPEDAPISFDEFVRFVSGQNDPAAMDSHWRPQVDSVLHPELSLGFVGHVETMAQDLVELSRFLFGRLRFKEAEVATVHLAPIRTDSHRLISDYFTPALAESVRERYIQDFRVFGYTLDLP